MTNKIDPKPDVALRAARAVSKLIFGGAQYRVEVGAAIATSAGKPVNATELADALGLGRQTINHELERLESAGLLGRVEQDSGRKVYYLAHASEYWAWCDEARADAASMLDRVPRY
jgi:DNA-binding transcriptional ArsR family regulator